MPTYEYVCGACDHRFEEFQSITAKPIRKCPECGRMKVKRLIGTGAGVIFRGSGFYETDYRSESYKKAAKADRDTASDKKSDSGKSSADSSSGTGSSKTGSGDSASTTAKKPGKSKKDSQAKSS